MEPPGAQARSPEPPVRPRVATEAPRPEPPARRASAAEPPVIRVRIGRVEVRAVPPPQRPAPPPRAAPRRPALTLDDYLKQRSEERR